MRMSPTNTIRKHLSKEAMFTEHLSKPSPFTCLYLAHQGVKGQKWGVRRGPPYPLKNSKKRGTILNDISIGRSLGAKAKNYDIVYPVSGEIFHFSEGTRIRNPKVFAGKGGVKELKKETKEGLAEQLGGNPDDGQHCKGIGTVDYYGEDRDAEVHWFQEPTVGKHKFRIKRWID